MEESAISPYSGGITAFENAQRVAASLAKSSLVPPAYQGQSGLANCIVALEIASRMRMSPLLVMQNLDVIHGRPSWKSSFLIGLINSCGKYTPLRFQYAGEGDDRSCYATTSDKATGEVIDGPRVTIKMAKAQGWYGRSGSKWPDMPDLMLSYRAAAFWSRLHAPELVLGYQTAEEVIDVEPVSVQAPTQTPGVVVAEVEPEPSAVFVKAAEFIRTGKIAPDKARALIDERLADGQLSEGEHKQLFALIDATNEAKTEDSKGGGAGSVNNTVSTGEVAVDGNAPNDSSIDDNGGLTNDPPATPRPSDSPDRVNAATDGSSPGVAADVSTDSSDGSAGVEPAVLSPEQVANTIRSFESVPTQKRLAAKRALYKAFDISASTSLSDALTTTERIAYLREQLNSASA